MAQWLLSELYNFKVDGSHLATCPTKDQNDENLSSSLDQDVCQHLYLKFCNTVLGTCFYKL